MLNKLLMINHRQHNICNFVLWLADLNLYFAK